MHAYIHTYTCAYISFVDMHMYVCLSVCMHVCMYVCMHISMYVHMYVYRYTPKYTHGHKYICISIYTHTSCNCVYACTYIQGHYSRFSLPSAIARLVVDRLPRFEVLLLLYTLLLVTLPLVPLYYRHAHTITNRLKDRPTPCKPLANPKPNTLKLVVTPNPKTLTSIP